MDCSKTPKYSHCPPRMDDGRHFTDYRSACFSNSLFRHENKIHCSHDYRSFLTHNALSLMKKSSSVAWKQNGCGPCKNLCLGIDETHRPGNSTPIDFKKCMPPKDYLRYNGAVAKPQGTSVMQRKIVPSGATISTHSSQYTTFPPSV